MLAIRKLNNNAVIARDSLGCEIVALGRGIGFGGDFPREVSPAEVERTFYRIGEDGKRIMQDLPAEVVIFTAKVMDIAANELPYELGPNAVLVMADHISFAMERQKKGINFDMSLAYDVKQLYPVEFKIGRFIVSRVQQEFGVCLPDEEVAGIAMNIVNSKADTSASKGGGDSRSFERLLNAVTGIVERDFRTIIDRDGFAYSRFATHIQYLYRRLEAQESIESDNLPMYGRSRDEFPELARCIDHISDYFASEQGTILNDEEKLYLMLHVNRIRTNVSR